MSSFVELPYELVDGAGYLWDIYSDGSISDGTNDAFDGGFDVYGAPFVYVGRYDDGVNAVTTLEARNGDVIFSREVMVSRTEGYARFYDSVTNYTDTAITYTYRLDNDFGANSGTIVESESGDGLVANPDDWFYVTDASDVDTPAVGVLYSERGAAHPDTVSQYTGTVDLSWTIDLAPGETKSFMTFGAQAIGPKVMANRLKALSNPDDDALNGLTNEQLVRLVNWNFSEASVDLRGTDDNDTMHGSDGEDVLFGAAGDDLLFGNAGDDELRGGFGADTIEGHDGDDLIRGDGTVEQVTTSARVELDDGQSLAISLTMPDAGAGKSVDISGFLSREEVVSENVDVVFVIDVSGSTSDFFSGLSTVPDLNGDGRANTILDAEIASFEALLESIVTDANLPDANVTIIPFESTAGVRPTAAADSDKNANGLRDPIETVRALDDSGGTNFERALIAAQTHFQTSDAGQKVLYFLSDGGNNEGGALDDNVTALLDLGVRIQSFGVGAGAVEADLDIVDDGIVNDSATIVLDPSELGASLLDPGIEAADITRLEVLRNGKTVAEIDPDDLVVTPFGLRYFEYTLRGLSSKNDDTIAVRATANDGSTTMLSTEQVLEDLDGKDKGDLLIGNGGSDTLEGGLGKDTLIGGTGPDVLRGGAGRDVASYVDASRKVVVDLDDPSRGRGDARGDDLTSIEDLAGSRFGDALTGNGRGNSLFGDAGHDRLDGAGGNDTLKGGAGRDTLTGGDGRDKFVFREGYGKDTIRDFDPSVAREKIDLRDFDLANFSEVQDLARTTRGGDTVLRFGGGDILTILDVAEADLSGNDFIL